MFFRFYFNLKAFDRASKISFAPVESAPFKGNDSFCRRKEFIRQTLDLLETDLKSEKQKIIERKKRQRSAAKNVRKAIPTKANKMNQAEKLRKLQNEDQQKLKVSIHICINQNQAMYVKYIQYL